VPGGPAIWREALLALPAGRDPCPGFQFRGWAHVRANALAFLEDHGERAAALGWTAEELFGVHPVVGVVHIDWGGALMLSNPGRVVQVEANLI